MDTCAFLGRFPIHTGPTPPLTPQTTLDACIQNFFFKFQLCKGWGKEELQENFERMHCLMREIKLCNEKLSLSTTPVSGQPRPQRHFRTVVDSNRSVSLPFDIRKILCTYPRKKKDIRGLQMFQIGDLSSFLAGGLTCIRCGDLFVSWSGFSKALVEKTRIHEAF